MQLKPKALQHRPMKLTRYTDYALRVMVYLANAPPGLVAIHTLAQACEAPENHIMKVTPALVRGGFVQSTRGRGGGLKLARPASEIRLGDIVRTAEGRFDLGGCVDCRLAGYCNISSVLAAAGEAFLETLNRFTLADMLGESPLAVGCDFPVAVCDQTDQSLTPCGSVRPVDRAGNCGPETRTAP